MTKIWQASRGARTVKKSGRPNWIPLWWVGTKVIYPKWSKQWLSTVAHTIDCLYCKILNHGLNIGLLFSLFKFCGWKNIWKQLKNSGLRSRFLFCLIFQFCLMYRLICQKPTHFLSAQMALVSTFFQMFIVLGMYNFAQILNYIS